MIFSSAQPGHETARSKGSKVPVTCLESDANVGALPGLLDLETAHPATTACKSPCANLVNLGGRCARTAICGARRG
jgi:hypothetical protein